MWGDDRRDLEALDRWITREPPPPPEWACETPGCDGVVYDENELLCDHCAARRDADTDTDTKGDDEMNTTANDNDRAHDTSAPAMLDTVLAVLAAAQPAFRWALEGWAAHLRLSRHQNHAASSWAKHAQEFVGCSVAMRALVVARCMDHGCTADAARELIDARVAARAASMAATS